MSGRKKEDFMNRKQVLIIIPTINERENLVYLLPMIFSSLANATVLIVDDCSTDGTVEYAESMINPTRKIEIIKRDERLGIGSAHVTGLIFAIENQFKFCITMDADLTHDPKYLPEMISLLENEESISVVIGSRFIEAGGISSWNFSRKVMTNLGHALTYSLLGMKWDVSSGLRGYKTNEIDSKMLKWLEKSSYEFFPKSAYYFKKKNLKIYEIFVCLPRRTYGNSKMSLSKVVVLLMNILKLRIEFAINSRKERY